VSFVRLLNVLGLEGAEGAMHQIASVGGCFVRHGFSPCIAYSLSLMGRGHDELHPKERFVLIPEAAELLIDK
jgi:hypothetical protein